MQELAIGRVILELQRVEAGRHAGLKHLIVPANGAYKNLGPAVLVEEDCAGFR